MTRRERKEILCQQLQILAEATKNGAIDSDLSNGTYAMVELDKALDRVLLFFVVAIVFFDFLFHFIVFIKKFGWGKIG